MPPKPKLRSVKPTAKDEIAALNEEAASWKQEATEAEQQIQEALRLLGLGIMSDLVSAIKELRATLEMDDTDKRPVGNVVADKMSAAEDITRYEKDKETAEAEVARLDEALSATREDRAALLKHFGLTARAWWDLGGAHEAHLEVHPWEE